MINVGNRVMNTFVYPIDDGYVMVDTGYSDGFESRKKKLCRHNIQITDIKYIFLTHAHDDHAGFLNDMIAENPNIKVIMSEKGIGTLRLGKNPSIGGCSGLQSYLFCLILKLFGKGKHEFPPIKEDYEGNLVLVSDYNKNQLEKDLQAAILETPGHTSDSISLLRENGDLFCGDAAMNGFPARNNIIIWIEDKEQYRVSWEKIISLNPKAIYPAHGSSFDISRLVKSIDKISNINMYKLSS